MSITLIGTSHIARESIQAIRTFIEEQRPDIIAVELDKRRLAALLEERRRKVSIHDIKRMGVKGFLFALIGSYIQEKLGKYVGVKPGSDMLEAVTLARKHTIQLALIDRPIEVTLRRFSASLTWREKFSIIADIFMGLVFRQRQMKKLGLDEFDLRKVPTENLIRKMMKEMKKRYPNIYRVLVTERNEFMARRLRELQEKFPEKDILAVVGAGHKNDIEKLLKKKKIRTESDGLLGTQL
jgi:pheromone shutdown-related protein TraB